MKIRERDYCNQKNCISDKIYELIFYPISNSTLFVSLAFYN